MERRQCGGGDDVIGWALRKSDFEGKISVQGILWGVTAVEGRKGGRIVQRGEFSCSSVWTETSAVPPGIETGDPQGLSCFGTGGLGLHLSEVSFRHWDVATREGGVTLRKLRMVWLWHHSILQWYQNYFFSFSSWGVGLTFCLLWKHEDWAILFPLRENSFWTWASWWIVVPLTEKCKGRRWQGLWNKPGKNVHKGGGGYQIIPADGPYSSSVPCSSQWHVEVLASLLPSFLPCVPLRLWDHSSGDTIQIESSSIPLPVCYWIGWLWTGNWERESMENYFIVL